MSLAERSFFSCALLRPPRAGGVPGPGRQTQALEARALRKVSDGRTGTHATLAA